MNKTLDRILTFTPFVGIPYVVVREAIDDFKDKRRQDYQGIDWQCILRCGKRAGKVAGVVVLNALEVGGLYTVLANYCSV